MDYKWSLDALYTSLEDEHFLADWKKLEELCARYQERAACLGGAAPAAEIRAVLELQEELVELRAAMEEATQKLQNAILRKNGINAAIRKKEEDYKKLDEELEQERISCFGW